VIQSEYIPSPDAQQKHKFLAEMQGTQKPILPVHNTTRIELFHLPMQKISYFNSPPGPIWSQAVKIWNHYANMNANIFYNDGQMYKRDPAFKVRFLTLRLRLIRDFYRASVYSTRHQHY
jgi:hypothetical protein